MQTLRNKALRQARDESRSNLPRLFFRDDLINVTRQVAKARGFDIDQEAKLRRQATAVDLKWNKRAQYRVFTFEDPSTISSDDLIALWTNKRHTYLSHFSAIFFHNLTDQRPRSFFLTSEVEKKAHTPSPPIEDIALKQSYLKPHRHTENYFTYRGSKFYLLQKQSTNLTGMTKLPFTQSRLANSINVTNLERTFLDSVISPHYSGGITNVPYFFRNVDLDIHLLLSYYVTLNPQYPFWQNIGLILEKIRGKKVSEQWSSFFNNRQKREFFLDKEYKPFWKFSEDWQVHYPAGVFGD